MQKTLILALALSTLSAQNCRSDDPKVQGLNQDSGQFKKPRVRPEFADAAVKELLQRKNWQHAYALLSESGMQDRGQHAIIVDGEQWSYRWWDKPDLKTAHERPLSANEKKKLHAAFQAATDLNDLAEPSFDGVSFEYWVLKKDAKPVVQQVYMRNPSLASDKRYDALVSVFLELQR